MYVFGVMEEDFDRRIHALTGLIDIHENPIVRMVAPKRPIGFGRDREWPKETTTARQKS